MTLFMQRLARDLGEAEPEALPRPALRGSTPTSFGEGSNRYVAIRSLAEQLVSEANAVISDPRGHLFLSDEVGGEELAFTITCAGHAVRVATRFAFGRATAQILSDDLPHDQPLELVGPEALGDLIVRLCLLAGLHNEDSAHLY